MDFCDKVMAEKVEGYRTKQFENDQLRKAFKIPRKKVAVMQRLDHGTSGRVYAGMWKGSLVALKSCDPSIGPEELQKEAAVLEQMHDPHIVHFFGLVMDNDTQQLMYI